MSSLDCIPPCVMAPLHAMHVSESAYRRLGVAGRVGKVRDFEAHFFLSFFRDFLGRDEHTIARCHWLLACITEFLQPHAPVVINLSLSPPSPTRLDGPARSPTLLAHASRSIPSPPSLSAPETDYGVVDWPSEVEDGTRAQAIPLVKSSTRPLAEGKCAHDDHAASSEQTVAERGDGQCVARLAPSTEPHAQPSIVEDRRQSVERAAEPHSLEGLHRSGEEMVPRDSPVSSSKDVQAAGAEVVPLSAEDRPSSGAEQEVQTGREDDHQSRAELRRHTQSTPDPIVAVETQDRNEEVLGTQEGVDAARPCMHSTARPRKRSHEPDVSPLRTGNTRPPSPQEPSLPAKKRRKSKGKAPATRPTTPANVDGHDTLPGSSVDLAIVPGQVALTSDGTWDDIQADYTQSLADVVRADSGTLDTATVEAYRTAFGAMAAWFSQEVFGPPGFRRLATCCSSNVGIQPTVATSTTEPYSSDDTPVLLERCSAAFGRSRDAEYESTAATRVRLQRIAEFHMHWTQLVEATNDPRNPLLAYITRYAAQHDRKLSAGVGVKTLLWDWLIERSYSPEALQRPKARVSARHQLRDLITVGHRLRTLRVLFGDGIFFFLPSNAHSV